MRRKMRGIGLALLSSCCLCIPAHVGAQANTHTNDRHADAERPTGSALSPDVTHVHGTHGPTDMWLPASAPDAGRHVSIREWNVGVHGQAFMQFVTESGSGHYRGRQVGSTNWFMASAERANAAQRVQLRMMLTGEPWTVRGCGYPNLLATGETCGGDSIHDRQHPHDLFMELAASYEHTVAGSLRWGIYGGPVGAPALGPPQFMHRPSAMSNPIAPIGHHWLDSTHVTFGVLTAALSGARWKLESSVFNGRDPDEQRYDFDLAPLDSFSGRLSINPTAGLALQVSAGHRNDAEAGIGQLPRQDVNHVTASAISVRALAHGVWSTTIAYGLKWGPTLVGTDSISQHSSAVMVESAAATSERATWFGRAEVVGKSAHDLHADEFGAAVFTVAKLQFGYLRRVAAGPGVGAALGASVDAAVLPQALAPRYAGRLAPGVGVFLRLSTTDAHHN